FSADDLKAAITVLGGEDSPETGKFMRNLAKIRPDLTIPFMVGQGDKQKLAEGKEPEGTEAERIQTSWDKAVRTEPKNLVDMPKDVWSKEEFRTALKKRYDQMNDKNKRNFRNRLEQMLMDKGEIRKEGEKLDILDKVIPPEGGGRGGASTVAYRQSPDVNEHNIIDLRTADWREDETE
ncbi:MAG TPA: hypothetical protein VFK07_02825, partial [Candidatus Paceibacterota bacterium]|nr:hypothetical protein [Candidatus Paceibacterota bacterium]